jgi:cell wall-associated NlpC family hydrolase
LTSNKPTNKLKILSFYMRDAKRPACKMKVVNGRINVSVANLYREATYGSEIINQGLLGERVSVEDSSKDFSQVTLQDGYRGWISNYQWVPASEDNFPTKVIREHLVHIRSEADPDGVSLRDATIGSHLSIAGENDRWYEVILPDGLRGWIENNIFNVFPPANRDGAIELIEEFLGYPYFWGGRSVKGFDCSGLIQTVFSLIGINIPRDSWMQQRDGTYVSDNPEHAEPGDLYFFSDTGSKITHVGMALGGGRVIHARGLVRLNSLFRDDPHYNEILDKSFVDIRTFF